MKARRWQLLALFLGTLFALFLFQKAQPASVWGLLRRTSTPALLMALALHGLLLALRSLRLQLISGHLTWPQSFLLLSTSQAASALLPWRLGELFLPPLAKWMLRVSLVKGALWWLANRLLDLWSLAALALAFALLGLLPKGLTLPAALLLLFASALAFAASWRPLWRLLWRYGGKTRKALLRFRLAVRRWQRRKPMLLAALGASLGSWGLVMAFTAVLSQGMGIPLKIPSLVLAVFGAALGALVPVAGIGNLGPLDAGFAAALSTTGMPSSQALALAFALHLWTLCLQLLYGFLAMSWLALSSGSPSGNGPKAQDESF